MNKLKIALLQVSPCGSLDKNLEKGIKCCEKAKGMGADIALFPEMWSNGYNIYGRPQNEWIAEAIPSDGAFVNAFAEAAGRLGMAVGVTLLEKYEKAPRNTLVLFDRFGQRKLRHKRVEFTWF